MWRKHEHDDTLLFQHSGEERFVGLISTGEPGMGMDWIDGLMRCTFFFGDIGNLP